MPTIALRPWRRTPLVGWHGAVAAAGRAIRFWTFTLWEWNVPRWACLELEFADEAARDGFRVLPAVTAALDAVPDPVAGVLVYPGRGGGSAAGNPRRPRPAPAAGAAVADESRDQFLDLAVD